jgi:glycosyltransferase involved in cell wall biosynthesis
MPTVSVIIPCHNHGRFLREAIDSVLAQSVPSHEIEIIVVDDGSTDGTRDVVCSYDAVRYIYQQNKGPGAARNRGIRSSKGEYLVFLDADDRLLPHHFARCLDTFEASPELMLVWGDFRFFGEDGTWHTHTCAPRPDHYGAMLRFGMMGPPASLMVKRAALEKVGTFRPDLRSCEDLEMWLRIARLYPVACHHELIAEYRRHAGQLHQQWDALLVGGLQVLREQLKLINGHAVYEEACRDGIEHHLEACGEPLFWQTVTAMRSHDWKKAAQGLWTLLRYYPQGMARLLHQKLSRVVPAS